MDRYQAWAPHYRYVLKLDVRRYFPSIDPRMLKQELGARIKDYRALDLVDRIIDTTSEALAEPHWFPGDDGSRNR